MQRLLVALVVFGSFSFGTPVVIGIDDDVLQNTKEKLELKESHPIVNEITLSDEQLKQLGFMEVPA